MKVSDLKTPETKKLWKLARRHARAQKELSWKGSQPPEYWEWIELEAKEAQTALLEALKALEDRP